MTLNKTHLIVFIVGAVLGLVCGFFSGKAIYDQPIKESVTRDTVTRIDTVSRYYPKPVEVEKVRTEYKWLTRVQTDTVTNYTTLHDSVLVEVPIESKHYHADEYDAYISGYMPSLDSIRVYQKETVITETITKVVKDRKHFFLDVGAGCEYRFNDKAAVPFAEIGLKFKTGRFGIGAYGGYSHDTNENKGLPNGRVKITYDIISF